MKSFSLFGYVVFFIFMLSCFLSHAQNLPGGLISSSTTAVTVTVSGNNITMANGIITMTINKTNAQITALHYNGNDLLGVGSGNGNTFYWSWTPTTLGAEETPANCTYTLVADPATNGGTYAEIKLSRPYNPANGALAAWDVDCHYSLLKGSQGFYASGVFSRQTSYPAYIMGETRFLGKINNGIFNWYSQDSLRNNFIPTLYDQTNSVVVVNAPKEVTQVETGIDSGQYLCKYSYTGDFGDMRVWGWSSVNENTGDPAPNATNTGKNIGLWMTCPSIEYYNGGPKKREISWVFLNMLNGEHYGMGDSFSFAQGEAYQKVYGPFFIYCNTYKGLASASSATIATTLFNDAQVQTQVEAGAWPYTWFNNTAYAQKATRATVSGTLEISDPGNPIASAEGMWIGLAPDSGDFQHQAKTYQFWVKTGTNGTFTIPNVLPGTYNLNAFGPGSPGTFQRKNIIVTAGQTLNLGTISWTPPRIAPTVWEIGIPDRDTKEFFNGYSAEAGVLPPYAQWQTSYINYPTQFPNGVNYTIGTSNWAKDWNYAQVTNANNNWATSPWTVNFSLPNAPTTGSKAALHLALASNYTSHLTITVNGSQIYSSAMANASDAVIRLASHGAFYDTLITFNGSLLKQGNNIIILNQVKAGEGNTIQYDYLRLEASGVTPPAIITTITPTTFCSGDSIVLKASTGKGYTYIWYRNDTILSGAVAANYNAKIAGSYNVKVTASSGYNTISTATAVTVNPLPSSPTVTTSITYCQNAVTIPLTATGTSLKWYTIATSGTGTVTAPTPLTTTIGNTMFYVSQTVTGCEGPRASINVTVNANPTISNAGTNQYITSTNIILAANTPISGTGSWSVISGSGTFANTSSPTSSVIGLKIGANVLQWTISNGSCTPSVSTVTINVGSKPVSQIITGPSSVSVNQTGITYSVPYNLGSTYHWTLPPGAVITSANSDSSSITVSFGTTGGNVAVIETNSYGSTTDTLPLTISAVTTGIVLSNESNLYEVKPNPFSDYSTIRINTVMNESVSISIIGINGDLVFTASGYSTNEDIIVGSNLASGVYFLQLSFGSESKVIKLVKIQ